MSELPFLRLRAPRIRRWIAGLLGLVLAVSAAVPLRAAGWGSLHFHRAAEGPADAGWMAGWDYFARVDRAAAPRGADVAQAHAHDGLARHLHRTGEAGVVALDAGAASAGDGAGAMGPAWGLPPAPWALPVASRPATQRPVSVLSGPRARPAEPPERPPRA